MMPPVFPLARGTPELGDRVYPFGQAPNTVADPYCVWRLSGGSPENYIGTRRPDLDGYTIQFDIYGASAESVESAAKALRDKLEGGQHVTITSWLGTSRDDATQRYVFRLMADWWVPRS